MDRLFVDTNIVMDLLTNRQPFYSYAAKLFTLADKGNPKLYVSSVCFNNINYLLSKQYNRTVSKKILIQFKVLVTVLAVDDKIINLALNSSFNDFEDAIQYFTAIENKIPVIITRDLKDFKEAAIPVMTAEVYLKGIGSNY